MNGNINDALSMKHFLFVATLFLLVSATGNFYAHASAVSEDLGSVEHADALIHADVVLYEDSAVHTKASIDKDAAMYMGTEVLMADSTMKHDAATQPSLEELFWSRRTDQKMSFDAADVNFMMMMIPHHAQALVMSEMADKNDAGPAVRTLASRIMNAQGDEIATMQRWLEVRKQSVPRISVDGIVMTIEVETPEVGGAMDHEGMDHSEMGHGEMDHEGMDHSEMGHSEMHHPDGTSDRSEMIHGADHDEMNHSSMDHSSEMHSHHDMPGMLSQEELEHLASLRGEEFDRWYLTYMIGHHQGAIIMVDELFASEKGGRDEESFRLASDIYTEQTTEIDRMKFMLRQMGF